MEKSPNGKVKRKKFQGRRGEGGEGGGCVCRFKEFEAVDGRMNKSG